MKFIILLIAFLAVTQCDDIIQENGFNLIGKYNISDDCNVYSCINTPVISGSNFICPQAGTGTGQITYSGGQYNLSLITAAQYAYSGQIQENFNQQNIVGNSQIQIPLQDGYTLNLMPCFDGKATSSLCPADPYFNDKVMVGWKSYLGLSLTGCSFIMMHQ